MDCSLLGSSVHGILQARILEWAAIFFSRNQTCKNLLQLDSLPLSHKGSPDTHKQKQKQKKSNHDVSLTAQYKQKYPKYKDMLQCEI